MGGKGRREATVDDALAVTRRGPWFTCGACGHDGPASKAARPRADGLGQTCAACEGSGPLELFGPHLPVIPPTSDTT